MPGTFGPGLPRIREWTEANFDFAGYVTGFVAPEEGEASRLRARFGFTPDDIVEAAKDQIAGKG